jgi:methyltransferase
MTTGTALFLAFIVVQRLGELVIARRNTARLMARGARGRSGALSSHGRAAHLLGAGAVGLGWNQPLHMGWLALYAVLQLFRVWILGTLGPRWTTRIIVIDEPLVVRGPFRFIPHPNYTLVVAEIIVAPMVLGRPSQTRGGSCARYGFLTWSRRCSTT